PRLAHALKILVPVIFAYYGEDNRHEYLERVGQPWISLADSSAALINDDNLTASPGGFSVKGNTFADRRHCPEERFVSAVRPVVCSGVLVGPDLVLTAGHCMNDENQCGFTNFAFGYREEGAFLKSENVYRCKKIEVRKYNDEAKSIAEVLDYSLVRLDRPVTDFAPALFTRGAPSAIDQSTELLGFGYPEGLALKIMEGAKPREIFPGTFTANLDAYNGNSGSSVFNLSSGRLLGILADGAADVETDPIRGCTRSIRWPENGGQGELMVRMEAILASLPVGLL
ncbi:MAG: serine protease, partial [Proteobacteria bacterium]